MTVHVTIALDEAVKAKLDALADARQAPIDDIVAMAVWDMAVEEEAAAFRAASWAAFCSASNAAISCAKSSFARQSPPARASSPALSRKDIPSRRLRAR